MPLPRLTGVLVARLHITSGALSMRLQTFLDEVPWEQLSGVTDS